MSQAKAYTGALVGRDGPDLARMAPASIAGLAAMHGQALMPSGSVTVLREESQLVAGIDCSGAPDDRVGNAYRGRQVEVCVAGDTVQIWDDERIIRTHAAKHDRRKEHGAFANPGGRPDRTNAV